MYLGFEKQGQFFTKNEGSKTDEFSKGSNYQKAAATHPPLVFPRYKEALCIVSTHIDKQ